MFGRHRNKEAPQDTDAAVEVHLEWDIDAVQQAVTAVLQNASNGSRQSLLAVLGRLDDQTALGDAYSQSIIDSPFFGQGTKGAILGETSNHSMAEEVPGTVLRAQVALVRAAKIAVRDQSPRALEDLRTASDSLAAASGQST
jgi:hypothetical protein